MAEYIHVVGVDPGLVHTGVVRFEFETGPKIVTVSHQLVAGPDALQVKSWIDLNGKTKPIVFIEEYRPRSHYQSDIRMVNAVHDVRQKTKGFLVNNTGMKKVVKRPLMEMFNVWQFSTVSHHQDLRAASMIALFGMLKDEDLNRVLADIVKAHLDGEPWTVKEAA